MATQDDREEEVISLADHTAHTKVLMEQIDALKTENVKLGSEAKEFSSMKEENAKLVKDLAAEKASIARSKKEVEFNELLAKGKAVAAQKEAFLAGDLAKFLELAQPVNLSQTGSTGATGSTGENELSAEEEAMFKKYLADHMTREEYIKSSRVSAQQ